MQRNLDATQEIEDLRGMVTMLTTAMTESEVALRGVCMAGLRATGVIRLLHIQVGDLKL